MKSLKEKRFRLNKKDSIFNRKDNKDNKNIKVKNSRQSHNLILVKTLLK